MKLYPRSIAIALMAILLVVTGTALAQPNQATVTVSPTEDTTTILQNPMMGFQDHEVSGNWYPWSTGYLRATATCQQNGRSVPCGPLNWDVLNPQQGTYNFNDIDLFISNMAALKKFVVFRVRNVKGPSTAPTVPQWAKDAGVTVSVGQEAFGGSSGTEIDYKKCAFLDAWGNLVQELARRYDNNPTISAVDIGSYGYYGEWFSGKTVVQRYPTDQVYDPTDPTLQQSIDTRTRIVRMFTGGSGTGRCVDNSGREQQVSYSYTGFKNKPVLINRGDQEDVAIGVANGAGIRFDGIGAADSRQKSFRTKISAYIAQTWKTKPIMGEFGTADYAPVDSTFMMRSLCFAREFHVSAIHNNFNTKPTIDLNPLFRELGYRIVLAQASYPSSAAAGSTAAFTLTWLNKGTAPAYQRYPLTLYFKPSGADTVAGQVALNATDTRQILPANVSATTDTFTSCAMGAPAPYSVTENVTIPALPAGSYDVYFGFQEPVYQNPIQLALMQKDSAGRYLLGQMTVQGAGQSTATTGGSTATVTATSAVTSTAVATTAVPATATKTKTPIPTTASTVTAPTATKTKTPVPTATKTKTPVPPTASTITAPTATKTKTPVPPTATLVQQTTPVVNQPGGSASSLEVQYVANDTDPTNEDIALGLNVVNTGSTAVSLTELKLRYYFTRDTAKAMALACDYAPIGCGKITSQFVQMPTPVTGADFYLELGFNSTAGSLAAGAQTQEIGVRINKTDWTNFNESNDYSFDGTQTRFIDWAKVTLYRNGALVWGTPPGGAGTTVAMAAAAPVDSTGSTTTTTNSIAAPSDTTSSAAPAESAPVTTDASTTSTTTTSAVDPASFQIVESTSSAVQQIGKWTAQDANAATSNRYLYSSGSPNDALSLTVQGSSFDVIYVKHPTFGTFAVEVDGAVVLTVDSVGSKSIFGTRAAVRNLPAGTHAVKVYAVSGVIAIDAFAVESLPGAAQPAAPVQPTDAPAQPAAPVQPTSAPPTSAPAQPAAPVEPTTPPTAAPQIAPVGLPMLDTFDGGAAWVVNGGWQPDGGTARQGQAWFINSTQRNQISTLEQPTPVDLRNAINPQLSFWQKADLSERDILAVEVTVDNGASWITLDQQSKLQTDWQQRAVNLSPVRGQIIRLRFRLDTTGKLGKARTMGVWIDELTIAEAPAAPAPATAVPNAAPTNAPVNNPPTSAAEPTDPPAPTVKPSRTPRPTRVPPTPVPPTAVPPTVVPPTAVPPTAVPPTAVPPAAPAVAQPDQQQPEAPANDAPVKPTRTRRNR